MTIKRTTITLLTTATTLAFLPAATLDAAPRKVIGENFTATWCTYCPAVAQGMILLMEEFPDTFLGFQIHGGDNYATAWGNSRLNFYNVSGYPTVWMDGVLSQVGSYGSGSANYNALRTMYLNRIGDPTDVTMCVGGAVIDSNTYQVDVNVGIEASGTPKTKRIHCVQLLADYPTGSQYYDCFIQASNYQDVTLSPGGETAVVLNFDLSGASLSNTEDVSFIAWAQTPNSSGPAEIHQAGRHPYNEGDCSADTFSVGPGGDFSTIGDALAASGINDIIEVAPGTYMENIDFQGKAVMLVSTDGAEATIIDGGSNDVVVNMYSGEGPSSVIDGFTLQHGDSMLGGGVRSNGTPTVRNCVIRDNTATFGGGIYQQANGGVGVTVSSTMFCGNTPTNIHGPYVDGGKNEFNDSCGTDPCATDVTGDSMTDVSDLLAIIAAWGQCKACDEDVTDDGLVNVSDLLAIIAAWGPCP